MHWPGMVDRSADSRSRTRRITVLLGPSSLRILVTTATTPSPTATSRTLVSAHLGICISVSLTVKDGPARHPDSVQKGSCLFLSTRPGDPTTPGYPSHEGVPRAAIDDVTPSIPSVPVSYAAVLPLLQALNGHGASAAEVNRTIWVGGLDADYSTGPAPGVVLNLDNQMEEKIAPVWNVIGSINGTNADETVVIGNHRDTWMIGGNGDPSSGSAILVELTKAFGKLLDAGWKPRRNMYAHYSPLISTSNHLYVLTTPSVLASWDAEEYGMIGSTEFVEEYTDWLTETAVAYLNIDVGVSGPQPVLSGTPELATLGTSVLKKIIAPNGGSFNASLYDVWQHNPSQPDAGGEVDILGSGSDYTAFVHRGIGALDIGSEDGPRDPVWHYHSNYDSYNWMANFGDPGFLQHAAVGQYLALLALHLVDDEVLPVDVGHYAGELRAYRDDLVEFVGEYGVELDLAELSDAIEVFAKRAEELKATEEHAVALDDERLVRVVNHKYRDFQRGFVSQGGLPDREFYKNAIVAPGLDTGELMLSCEACCLRTGNMY